MIYRILAFCIVYIALFRHCSAASMNRRSRILSRRRRMRSSVRWSAAVRAKRPWTVWWALRFFVWARFFPGFGRILNLFSDPFDAGFYLGKNFCNFGLHLATSLRDFSWERGANCITKVICLRGEHGWGLVNGPAELTMFVAVIRLIFGFR